MYLYFLHYIYLTVKQMIAPKEIKELVANYLSISDGLANELAAIATLVHYKKNDTIYVANEITSTVGFIKSGLVHSFVYDFNKHPKTVWFGEPGDFITSFHAFFTNNPGIETIQCIEPTTVVQFESHAFKALTQKNPEMLLLYSKILEECCLFWENRYIVNQINEAEERYADFYYRAKEMIIRIPLKLLASYLNIRQETLSRIRKNWLK